ncbi:MAG: nucleotidyl transferase AbiEii/AbiGii toxin family protein [Acidobacteria bacterium]|nr:nucleotidyl transferase AbiEii/AbiGii toxin family protein [Acidobacteriota bacterium]
MDAFLTQPLERQRLIYEEAGRRLGLSAGSVEKDLWVCWTLRALFCLPVSGPHLTFKGGTSLSKGWKLIDRFSEDIDIVIAREFLGFGGADAPEDAPSNKQRVRRLEALMHAARTHIRDVLSPALEQQVRHLLPPTSSWKLETDADDPDAQTLLFHYPPAMGTAVYVRPVVKIELGARSDTEPSATPEIAPYLAEVFPDEVRGSQFAVHAVTPERTFWEKVALLHEESYRESGAAPKARLARHYYDLWCLITRGVAERAIRDGALFGRVAAHRAVFFRRSRDAQASFAPGSLRIVPAADRLTLWRRDYDAMRESMFFGEVPEFAEILAVVGRFEEDFNSPRRHDADVEPQS